MKNTKLYSFVSHLFKLLENIFQQRNLINRNVLSLSCRRYRMASRNIRKRSRIEMNKFLKEMQGTYTMDLMKSLINLCFDLLF